MVLREGREGKPRSRVGTRGKPREGEVKVRFPRAERGKVRGRPSESEAREGKLLRKGAGLDKGFTPLKRENSLLYTSVL